MQYCDCRNHATLKRNDEMTKALIIALALLAPCAAMAEPSLTTRAAIAALYTANDEAQRAIDYDWCGEGDVDELAGDALTGEALRQYGHVSDAIMAAYEATNGSDGELEIVGNDFCEAAGER